MGVPLSVLKALPSIQTQVSVHCVDIFVTYISCVGVGTCLEMHTQNMKNESYHELYNLPHKANPISK